ncbi:MAG: hypothetical protein AAB540_04190, partial [Patescibacteria group bacterium]
LSPNGKTLTLNRTKNGTPETLTYTIENPDNLKLEPKYYAGDAAIGVSTANGSKSTWFEIDCEAGDFSTQRSDATQTDNLENNYDITLDDSTKTIKILKKAPSTTPTSKETRILKDGSSAIGTFDATTGNLIEGERLYPNGDIAEGGFDATTGNLIDGKVTRPNGEVNEGKFDKETGRSLPGNKWSNKSGKVFILNSESNWIKQP